MTRDWRNFFDASDFAPRCDCKWGGPCDCPVWPSEEVAEIANELLRRELRRAPRTWGDSEPRRDGAEVSAPRGKHYSSAMVDVRLVRYR